MQNGSGHFFISIPQWYDKRVIWSLLLIIVSYISIPQWYDKRFYPRWIDFWFSQFQFHNGTIKGKLKADTWYQLIKFQFHNGTIKGQHLIPIPGPLKFISIPQWYDKRFNRGILHHHRQQISIPQWYDKRKWLPASRLQSKKFQFHNGTIKGLHEKQF